MEVNPRDRWRRKRFTENLDRLLTERGLTRKAAAEKAGVKEQWLRRAVSRGIAWPDKRSIERLRMLADALGLDDVERLWERDFYVPPERSSIKDEAARLGELMRKYVMEVGAEDATLKEIVKQIRSALLGHRHRQHVQARQAKSGAEEGPKIAPGDQVRPATSPPEQQANANPRGIPDSTSQRPSTPENLGLYTLIARQTLDIFRAGCINFYNEIGLPGVAEVVPSVEIVTQHAELHTWASPVELADYVARMLWLPQYARLLGKTYEESIRFIEEHVARHAGGLSQGDRPNVAADDRPERVTVDEEVLARATAKKLAEEVLDRLSPEQTDLFYRDFRTVPEAQKYLENELLDRIQGRKLMGNTIPSPQAPDAAVEAVVAEIVEDFDRLRNQEDGGDSDCPADEPITLEEKPLEARHGNDVTPDEWGDHRGDPLPVGSDLNDEIARTMAEDREAAERHVGRLVDKVGESIEGEAPRGRSYDKETPAAEPTLPTEDGEGRVAEMSPEEFRRFVRTSHEDGLSVSEIAVALRNDVDGVPDWVRGMGRKDLALTVRDIIARGESGDDGPDPDEFDAQAQDDRRAWEMDYDRDPGRLGLGLEDDGDDMTGNG